MYRKKQGIYARQSSCFLRYFWGIIEFGSRWWKSKQKKDKVAKNWDFHFTYTFDFSWMGKNSCSLHIKVEICWKIYQFKTETHSASNAWIAYYNQMTTFTLNDIESYHSGQNDKSPSSQGLISSSTLLHNLISFGFSQIILKISGITQ